nr:hypothetical protein [Aureimonas ureilytica]
MQIDQLHQLSSGGLQGFHELIGLARNVCLGDLVEFAQDIASFVRRRLKQATQPLDVVERRQVGLTPEHVGEPAPKRFCQIEKAFDLGPPLRQTEAGQEIASDVATRGGQRPDTPLNIAEAPRDLPRAQPIERVFKLFDIGRRPFRARAHFREHAVQTVETVRRFVSRSAHHREGGGDCPDRPNDRPQGQSQQGAAKQSRGSSSRNNAARVASNRSRRQIDHGRHAGIGPDQKARDDNELPDAQDRTADRAPDQRAGQDRAELQDSIGYVVKVVREGVERHNEALRCPKAVIRLANITNQGVFDLLKRTFERVGGLADAGLQFLAARDHPVKELFARKLTVFGGLDQRPEIAVEALDPVRRSLQERWRAVDQRVELFRLDDRRTQRLPELEQRASGLGGASAIRLKPCRHGFGEPEHVLLVVRQLLAGARDLPV